MRSLPGLRVILKSLESRRQHHGATSAVADSAPTSTIGAGAALEEPHRTPEARTSLAPGLVALAEVRQEDKYPRGMLNCFGKFLSDEGYALYLLDNAGGFTYVAGAADRLATAEDLPEIRREIQALESSLGPDMAPVEITPQERTGTKITIYPIATDDGGLDCLLVLKGITDDAGSRTRREWLNLLGRFTSSIAHEIKNPLTGIAAGVQYLAKRLQPGATEADTVDFILAEIARLNRIVDDLYKIARPPQLVLATTTLNKVVTKSLFCLSEDVVRKRLHVEQSLGPDMPSFDADPERLQQVLINVIKNAIEASRENGTIEIATTADDARVTVKVTDGGPGIPPGERARIFEPFYSTKKGGTGLGLCISQAIIEEHGGRMTVESPPDGGARFVIEIPIGKPRGA
jgi:signal transduction histidine kinase